MFQVGFCGVEGDVDKEQGARGSGGRDFRFVGTEVKVMGYR